MNTMHKSAWKRIAGFVMGMVMLMSVVPENLLSFAAEELQNAALAEETEDQQENDVTETGLEHQVISASPNENSSSEVVTLDGLMPSNATVNVTSVDEEPEKNLCAYNISITDNNGSEFQPESGSSIKVDITNSTIGEAVSAAQKLRLWHIDDSGIREEIHDFKVKNDTITFEAKGFSVYEVDNGSPALRTYRFKLPTDPDDPESYEDYYFPTSSKGADGNFKMICQQTIKNGEKPIFPQLPANSKYTFVGWFVEKPDGTLEDEPFDFENVPPVTTTEQVVLKAVFKSCVFAIFHEQYNGTTRTFPVFATRRGDLVTLKEDGQNDKVYATINIGGLSVTYDDHDDTTLAENQPPQMIFDGWVAIDESTIGPADKEIADGNNAAGLTSMTAEEINAILNSNNNLHVYSKNDTITINSTTRLYPVFDPIRWVEFNSGEKGIGATYIPSEYFRTEDGYTMQAGRNYIPQRAGYIFDGWFTKPVGGTKVYDENCNIVSGVDTTEVKESDGKLYMKDVTDENGKRIIQTTLYAQWTPSSADYTIIIWQQKPTDTPDMDFIADRNFYADLTNEEYEDLVDEQKANNKVKSYSYFTSFTIHSTSEADAVVTDTYKTLNGEDFTGFKCMGFSPKSKVKGDCSTILNVYYDREQRTFTFKNENTVIHSFTALYVSIIFLSSFSSIARFIVNERKFFSGMIEISISIQRPLSSLFEKIASTL